MKGKRIATAASRKLEEFCTLVEKQGGIPIVRSMQGTVYLAEDVIEEDLRKLMVNGTDWFIFTTGVGTDTLLNQAEKLGIRSDLLQMIEGSKIAIRGYKTLAALKRMGIKPMIEDDDGTNRGLIRALERNNVDLSGQRVAVQLYGLPAPGLIEFLKHKGAIVTQLLPYKHVEPDPQIAETLCKEIIEGSVDAVCFTVGLQAYQLFDYAKQHGYYAQIMDAFASKVVAVAVGKLTAESLVDEGVKRIIIPESERLGAMVFTLRDYYGQELN